MAENEWIGTTVSKRWLKMDELEQQFLEMAENGWIGTTVFLKMAEYGWIETIVSKRWLKMNELKLQFLKDGWKWMNWNYIF